MSDINPNCDGAHCRHNSEVRVYPLGAGGNLILCHACFAHENKWRFNRAKECRCTEEQAQREWPQVNWQNAEHYPPAYDLESRRSAVTLRRSASKTPTG
jgi:hypothetical protein